MITRSMALALLAVGCSEPETRIVELERQVAALQEAQLNNAAALGNNTMAIGNNTVAIGNNIVAIGGNPPLTELGEEEGLPLPTAGYGNASLVVLSQPSGAQVLIGGEVRGHTPVGLARINASKPLKLRLKLSGYESVSQTVEFTAKERLVKTKMVEFKLAKAARAPTPVERVAATPEAATTAKKNTTAAATTAKTKCQGNSGRLTVATLGRGDCTVSVDGKILGVAPMFANPSPSGNCKIRVKCPTGKAYEVRRNIRRDGASKLIIESDKLD